MSPTKVISLGAQPRVCPGSYFLRYEARLKDKPIIAHLSDLTFHPLLQVLVTISTLNYPAFKDTKVFTL
jgi:hypothetical protein